MDDGIGPQPQFVSRRGRGRGARALRHPLLRLRPRGSRGGRPRGAGLPGAVRLHPALRDEGEPVAAASSACSARWASTSTRPATSRSSGRSRRASRRRRSSSPRRCRRGGWPSTSRRGVLFNACSLHQLDSFGQVAPGSEVSVRMNPGLGTGSTKRTNTGGPASSFGIWHEYLDEVKTIAERHRLRITRLHSPRRLGHRPGDLEALHPDDARAGGEAARGERRQPRRRLQGGAHARGADGRSRRRGRARARGAPRLPGPRRPARSVSRSSPARTSSRAPARWWRPASTWWTPGARATCSPSSTPA